MKYFLFSVGFFNLFKSKNSVYLLKTDLTAPDNSGIFIEAMLWRKTIFKRPNLKNEDVLKRKLVFPTVVIYLPVKN